MSGYEECLMDSEQKTHMLNSKEVEGQIEDLNRRRIRGGQVVITHNLKMVSLKQMLMRKPLAISRKSLVKA